MLLLTGATGTVGRPLLRRLIATGTPVRCLVREPGRLGPERERVQVAQGDLADPRSFAAALRGVDTVVHLASSIRDQRNGSIEELNHVATSRLVASAQEAGTTRFVFFSVLGASPSSPSRFIRAKVAAEQAVIESAVAHTIFAPAWVYDVDDPFVRMTERLCALPVMPLAGPGTARFEPIWAQDVAACVLAALPGGPYGDSAAGARYELAGPEALTYAQIVAAVLAARHHRRRSLALPTRLVRPGLHALERLMGPAAPATWDEVQLLQHTLLSAGGTADAERLGVRPRSMRQALAA